MVASRFELLSSKTNYLSAFERRANVMGWSQKEEGWLLKSQEALSQDQDPQDACDKHRGNEPLGWGTCLSEAWAVRLARVGPKVASRLIREGSHHK